MKLFLSQTLVLFQLGSGLSAAVYQDIIAPDSAAGVEGNSSLDLFRDSGITRFQQVYSSSVFSVSPQGGYIGALGFRADALTGYSFDLAASDIEIHLSTTSKLVDGLSSVFDENVGADDRVVRSRDPFGIGEIGGGGHQIGAWSDFVFIVDNPFYYNPAVGNLLLDIKIYAMPRPAISPQDAVNTLGDSVSSVATSFSTAPGMGNPSTLGLATFFAIQPIPEPGTVALGLVGLGLVLLTARKGVVNRGRKHGTH